MGACTNRDTWVYNSSISQIQKNVTRSVDAFFKAKEVFIASNKEDVKDRLADARDSVKGEISWSRGLLQKLSKQRLVSSFEPRKIQRSLYRPFIKQYLYYDREAFVEMPGKWSIVFPENSTENLVICSSGVGN